MASANTHNSWKLIESHHCVYCCKTISAFLPPTNLSQVYLLGTTSITTLAARESGKYRYLFSGLCDKEVGICSRRQETKSRTQDNKIGVWEQALCSTQPTVNNTPGVSVRNKYMATLFNALSFGGSVTCNLI